MLSYTRLYKAKILLGNYFFQLNQKGEKGFPKRPESVSQNNVNQEFYSSKSLINKVEKKGERGANRIIRSSAMDDEISF